MTNTGTRQYGAALAAVFACVVMQLAIAFIIVPPWQSPDEPQHLLTVRLVQAYGPEFSIIDTYPANEQALMASMARHGWWRYYNRPTPDPLPASMQEGPGAVTASRFGALSGIWLYYRGMAEVFRYTGVSDPTAQLYLLRVLSMLSAVGVVACAWAGVRRLTDELSALVVAALISLHPQFILMTISGTADPLMNLAGAVVWWQSAVLVTSVPASPRAVVTMIARIAAIWAISLAAVMSRRVAATLLPISAVATVWALTSASAVTVKRLVMTVAGAAAAIAAIGVAVYTVMPTETIRIFAQWLPFDPEIPIRNIPANFEDLPRFTNTFFRSFWLAAGWMRFWAPDSWYLAIALLSTTAFCGLLFTNRLLDRRAVALALVFVSMQLGITVAYHFGVRLGGAQGRYMFPVLPAVMFLFWTGWRTWFDDDKRNGVAAASLVTIVAAFNVTAWTIVVLPVYS